MAFKVELVVEYLESKDFTAKTWTKTVDLESTVPEEIVERAGRPVSYHEYKHSVAQQLITPFMGAAAEFIALDEDDSYFVVRRDDIQSARVTIKKTLDT